MKSLKLRRIITASLFAALSCVATLIVRIPTVAGGYTNFGDVIVLLGAFILGPWYGFAAGGIGSAFADFLAGSPHYVPGTFLIKGGSALIAAVILSAFKKRRGEGPKLYHQVLSALPAELFMVLGYFAYKALILGRPEGAVISLPGNLVQGLVGVIIGTLLYNILTKIPAIKKYL